MGQIGAVTSQGKIELSDKESKVLLAWLNKRKDDGVDRLSGKLAKWTLIRNYLSGTQWYSEGTGARYSAAQRLFGGAFSDGDADDETYENNVILRIHMSNMQRIGRYQPKEDVDPTDSSAQSKEGARKSQIVISDLKDKNRYKSRLRRKLDRHILSYGASYIKTTIDPNAGQEKVKPILNEYGQVTGYEEDEDGTEGQVVWDVPAAKNIILSPNATDVFDADYLIEYNIRTIEYVLRTYGQTVKGEGIDAKEVKWWRLGRNSGRDQAKGEDREDNLCVVNEGWIRRCEEFPLGAHVIWTSKHVLQSTTLDDHYPDIPYHKAEFIYDDEDPDGDTTYWHMIPQQQALNAVESDIKAHERMMCKPKWQQHMETTLQDPDGITNETAQVLRWTGPQAPGIINAPELPQTVFTWRNMIMDEMMSLGAAHDIIRPAHPRSGTAIAYEQEQDDTVLAPTVDSMGVQHEDACSFSLKLVSQYYITPRQFTMKKAGGQQVSQEFCGADLHNQFKVRVNMQSGLPANKIAKQQLIVQLKNQDIITKEQAQEHFEFGQTDEAIRDQTVMYERAQKIVENIINGNQLEQFPMMPFDDYGVILQVATRAARESWMDYDQNVQLQFKALFDQLKTLLTPTVPISGVMPAGGGNPGGVPAKPPMAPPGVPTSGQAPGQQPPKMADAQSLYDIPGMHDEPAPAAAP